MRIRDVAADNAEPLTRSSGAKLTQSDFDAPTIDCTLAVQGVIHP